MQQRRQYRRTPQQQQQRQQQQQQLSQGQKKEDPPQEEQQQQQQFSKETDGREGGAQGPKNTEVSINTKETEHNWEEAEGRWVGEVGAEGNAGIKREEEGEWEGATAPPPPPSEPPAAAPKTWFRRPEVLAALNPEPFNEKEFMFKGINDPDPDPEMEEQIQKLKEQGREEAWAKVI